MRYRLLVLLASVLAVTATACGSSDAPEVTDTLTLAPTSRDCLTRNIDGAERAVCFVRADGTLRLEADGLQPDSSLTIKGSGNTLVLTVDTNEAIQSDVGGQIVAASFTVRGTWSDGDELSLTVDYTD